MERLIESLSVSSKFASAMSEATCQIPPSCLQTLRLPAIDRTQPAVHELVVLFTQQMRIFSNKLGSGTAHGDTRGGWSALSPRSRLHE